MCQVRSLRLTLPCWLRLGCAGAGSIGGPPPVPLEASWPSHVLAVGLHTTSTLEVVSALRPVALTEWLRHRDAITEAWGRGGAAGHPKQRTKR